MIQCSISIIKNNKFCGVISNDKKIFFFFELFDQLNV